MVDLRFNCLINKKVLEKCLVKLIGCLLVG